MIEECQDGNNLNKKTDELLAELAIEENKNTRAKQRKKEKK